MTINGPVMAATNDFADLSRGVLHAPVGARRPSHFRDAVSALADQRLCKSVGRPTS